MQQRKDVGRELSAIEVALEKALATDVGLLSQASQHVIRSGGKRLRPRLLLLSYQAAGGTDASQALPLAVAVELLHTATLIHDDINDCSVMRRGQETVNARWGDSLALLAGDFMFVRLLSLIAPFGRDIIQVVADCCTAIVEGETLHMFGPRGDLMTDDLYLRIIKQKTASLFSACAELGGMLAEAPQQQLSGLSEFGLNVGMAFQIRDDTLDLVGQANTLGKPVNIDFSQGKTSLATLFALKQSPRAGEALLSQDTVQVVQLLSDTGALEYAMHNAVEYANRAKDALAVLPQSRAKAALCDLADFAVSRDR